jgi:hypothetical protein
MNGGPKIVLIAGLFLALAMPVVPTGAQTVTPARTDILGWYVGESIGDWKSNPHLGGNGDVCTAGKVPRNVKDWCKAYVNAINGQRSTVDTPPYHFVFIGGKIQQLTVDYPSFDVARAAAALKFGEPSSDGMGSGDITSLGGTAIGGGREATWNMPDGAIIMVHETIVSDSLGVQTSASVIVVTAESLRLLVPGGATKAPTL